MEVSQIDFESKCRSKHNFQEFMAIKHNLYFPKESAFNTRFIEQVLSEQKLLLQLSECTPPELAYIKDAHLFDKKALLRLIRSDEDLNRYIPDDVNESRLNREFLICILFYKKRNVFDNLYEHYKMLRRQNAFSSVAAKTIQINEKFKETFLNFAPSKIEKKSKQFLKNVKVKIVNQDNENVNLIRRDNNLNPLNSFLNRKNKMNVDVNNFEENSNLEYYEDNYVNVSKNRFTSDRLLHFNNN